MQVEGCIFCQIALGEIGARLVYEDDAVVAFHDIAPQAPVHVLVVPRDHYDSLNEVPEECMGDVGHGVVEAAKATGIDESGYRVIVNTGPDACQSIDHMHVHVLGGGIMSHGMVRFTD